MGVGKWALPGLLLVSTTCGTTPGDVCALADVKLDDCAAGEGGGPVFFDLPLNASAWHEGCQTAFERCAAKCVLTTSCEGMYDGMVSRPGPNNEPSFDACMFTCK